LSRRLLFPLAGLDILAPALRAVGQGILSILMIHRFKDPEHDIVGHDPTAIRDQLAYLRRHRYRLVSLTDALKLLDDGGGSTAPAVAFTVDDGYDDFVRIGAPIFAEYDCPVTVFVPTGFLDGQLWLWWDRVAHLFKHTRRSSLLLELGPDHRPYRWATPGAQARVQNDVLHRLETVSGPQREAAIASLSSQLDVELPASPPPAFAPISWDDVRRAAKHGVTFGPHTVTHPILTLATEDVCHWEIQESYRRVRQETDAAVPVFCYPAGQAGQRELKAAQRAGFEAAVTTVPAYAAPQGIQDRGPLGRFSLPRFPCPEDRPHLVNIVTGLARFTGVFRRSRA